jgi:uncharacterized protein (DUF2267 family)
VEYAQFIDIVERAAGGLAPQTAERAAQATLETLAERLPEPAAQHLFKELPARMQPWVSGDSDAGAFDVDEFIGRVAHREAVDIETALDHARAVFFALGDAVGSDEVDHVAAVLPPTFELLVAEARHQGVRVLRADQFWRRVAQGLSVDVTVARRITSAVLETLAKRIAADQVLDLVAQLDPLLHPPLRAGLSVADPDTRRMSLGAFLRSVARRECIQVDSAGPYRDLVRHAHAVLDTLRAAIDEQLWDDVATELPTEYRNLMPVRSGLPANAGPSCYPA